MAEYSASTYAKTPEEKAYYLQYYRDYYKKGGDDKAGDVVSKPSGNTTAPAATKPSVEPSGPANTVNVNGVEYKRYREYTNQKSNSKLTVFNVWVYSEGSLPSYIFDFACTCPRAFSGKDTHHHIWLEYRISVSKF